MLAAALALADEQGLAAVSMRSVAAALGVTPMALYRHVGDKQELLDGLVEQLLMELPLPDPALPWRARLDLLGLEMRRSAARHPEVVAILLQRPAATPGALRVRESVYVALRDAGIAESDIPRSERMLSTFVIGFAISQASGRFSVSRAESDHDFAWFTERFLAALIREV